MDLSTISQSLRPDATGIWRGDGEIPEGTLEFLERGHADLLRIEDDSFWFAHRNEVIALTLQRHGAKGPFLDIGGGNGVVSRRLERAGLETVLLEPGVDGAKHGKKRGLENVACATLEAADFLAGSFGSAGLFDVIEHVDDDASLLEGARRVLRADGVLAVTVPAYQWLWSAEDDAAGHCRRYTMGQLRKVLDGTGFVVEYTTHFFVALTLPIFLARSVPHRLGRRSVQADLRNVEVGAAEDHVTGKGARRAIDALLAPEIHAVRAGRSLPFGSSCLAIARVRGAR